MRTFQVCSKTKEGVFYQVEILDDKILCNCPAGERGFECNHKDLIKKFLDRKLISLDELSRIKEI